MINVVTFSTHVILTADNVMLEIAITQCTVSQYTNYHIDMESSVVNGNTHTAVLPLYHLGQTS